MISLITFPGMGWQPTSTWRSPTSMLATIILPPGICNHCPAWLPSSGACSDHGYHLALASSGDRVKVAFGMQALALNGIFEAVVTGDDVAHSKPDPEIYLIAAQQLAVPPKQCLAIEDAPAGVEAAKRAGMRCVAVTNSVAPEQLHKADLIVGSLADDLSPMLPV